MIDLQPILDKAKQIMKITVSCLLGILIIGYTYQTITSEQDRSSVSMPGKLLKVDGHAIHLYCTGSGSPTILLEAGSGEFSSSWGWIQPELTKETRVCSYDRQGRGWSTGKTPSDIDAVAKDLHAALTEAQFNDQYILVGHSLGGIYARKYQELYPDDVIGLVLVDSSHPNQLRNNAKYVQQARNAVRDFTWYANLSRIGIFKAYYALGGTSGFSTLPQEAQNAYKRFWSDPDHFISMADENTQIEKIFAQAQEMRSLGGLPVRVISSDDSDEEWNLLQGDLLNLSSESTRVTIPGSTHMSLLFKQEDAMKTSEVILALLESVRPDQT